MNMLQIPIRWYACSPSARRTNQNPETRSCSVRLSSFQGKVKSAFPYLVLPYIILPSITLHYRTLPYPLLHYITVHYLTLYYLTLPFIILPYLLLPYTTVNYRTLPFLTFYCLIRYLKLPYITFPCLAWPYITVNYLALPYLSQLTLLYVTLHRFNLLYFTSLAFTSTIWGEHGHQLFYRCFLNSFCFCWYLRYIFSTCHSNRGLDSGSWG